MGKTEQVLLHIIGEMKGELGRTRLIKLAYLSDYVARLLLGRSVTSFNYRLFERGPFDPAFYASIQKLGEQGFVEEHRVEEWDGCRYEIRREIPKADMTPEELFVVNRVIEEYGRLPLEVLLDEVVYKTEPARRAKEAAVLRIPIDLDSCNNRFRERFGFDLTTYLRSEAARAGGRPAGGIIENRTLTFRFSRIVIPAMIAHPRLLGALREVLRRSPVAALLDSPVRR